MYKYLLFPFYVSALISSVGVKRLRENRISVVSATNKTLSGFFFPPEERAEEQGPVEKFANFMGFEPEEKWKAVRYTAYAMAGGYMLSETVQDFIHGLNAGPFENV